MWKSVLIAPLAVAGFLFALYVITAPTHPDPTPRPQLTEEQIRKIRSDEIFNENHERKLQEIDNLINWLNEKDIEDRCGKVGDFAVADDMQRGYETLIFRYPVPNLNSPEHLTYVSMQFSQRGGQGHVVGRKILPSYTNHEKEISNEELVQVLPCLVTGHR
jgi:hypothetical protein